MPLSEREQQILDQLERDLTNEGGRSPSPSESRSGERFRGLKLGIVLFVAGILLLVWFFASGLLVAGVAAFAAMVGGIVLGASSIRAEIGRGGGPSERVARAVGDWERNLRRRYGERDRGRDSD